MSVVKEDKYLRLCAAEAGAEINSCSCSGWADRRSVFRPGAVDLPLFDCFVLVHIDGGDGMLGAGLHLPVHLPLGVLRLGLEQVHPFLRFDPEKRKKKKKKKNRDQSVLLEGDDLCARSEVSAPLCAADLLHALRHGRSNCTDESITEMNEDDGAMIHEARRLKTPADHTVLRHFTGNNIYKALNCFYTELLLTSDTERIQNPFTSF